MGLRKYLLSLPRSQRTLIPQASMSVIVMTITETGIIITDNPFIFFIQNYCWVTFVMVAKEGYLEMSGITLETERYRHYPPESSRRKANIMIHARDKGLLNSLVSRARNHYPSANIYLSHSPADAAIHLRRRPIHWVVIDCSTKKHDLENIKQLLDQQTLTAPVIALVETNISNMQMLMLFKLGAQGFIQVDSTDFLLAQITNTISAGYLPIPNRLMQYMLTLVEEIPSLQQSLVTDHRLSIREKIALSGIAKGLTTANLAIDMGVSQSTARTYIRRIYKKLDISSRAEAASAARRLGISAS